ncbi:translation initiation factor eIF-1A [Candidatus Pacearchaeota archaeon]|nr:translation initiation factor eIF-1A [Candidatus Pacearchaeota archaeon]
MGKYGEFEEIINEQGVKVSEGEAAPVRVKLPREGEVLGIIMQRLGGNRMEVQCTDGKIRNCRVPGRFKRSMWLRPKDVVLVKPWSDDDSKADIIFHYHSSAINQLRKRGLLSNLQEGF